MKRMIITLILLTMTALPALAAPTNTSGPWGIDAGGFKNLSTALASPSTIGKSVIISKPMAINNKVLPEDRHIKFLRGGSINPAAGKIFDYNGQKPEAGFYQIHGGAGSITGLIAAAPEWTGAKTGATTSADNVAAIQKAQDSLAPGGEVYFAPRIYLLKGRYLTDGVTARLYDGVKLKNDVSYRGVKNGTEIRLDLSCIIAFATRQHVALTDISQAPRNIGFYGIKFTRPGSTWADSSENTAPLYIGAVNGLIVRDCDFVGWPGDAIMLGMNDNSDLTWALDTFIRDVDIGYCNFDGVNKDNRQAISMWAGENVRIHHFNIKRTTRSTGYSMPGAIDIEPILASSLISNVVIENGTFDDIGGTVGVVAFAISTPLTVPAHNLRARKLVFKNITNISNFFIVGKTAPDETAITAGSPYDIKLSGNTHELPAAGSSSRRYIIGGVKNISITDETVVGGNTPALFGYGTGLAPYPIEGLYFKNNLLTDWIVPGTIYDSVLTFNGGVLGGDVSGNTFKDCGNSAAGVPVNMTVLSMVSGGVYSKNVSFSSNAFINTGAFSASSFPLYASAGIINPTTFRAKNNTFIGFNSYPYTGADSLYSQIESDFYSGFSAMPDSVTPNVSGASKVLLTTWSPTTNFLGGRDGQMIIVMTTNPSANTIVHDVAKIRLKGAVPFAMQPVDTLTLVNKAGIWIEVTRSVN